MPNKIVPSFKGDRGIKKLGSDIAIARRRRKFSQQRLADGAGVGIATVQRLEGGDPGVSIGNLMMVLVTLGESQRLADLIDMSKDDVGLLISADDLPKKIRTPKRKVVASSALDDTGDGVDFNNGTGF